MTSFQLGEIQVTLEKKRIKNIHLSVYPPEGAVRVSAPSYLSDDVIRVFTIQKLDWIKKQQSKLKEQARETLRGYQNKESHYFWGRRYLLKNLESDGTSHVTVDHKYIKIHSPIGLNQEHKQKVLEDFYRKELREQCEHLIHEWSPRVGVELEKFYIQKMKTKWGSCSPHNKSIRLNLELVKKPSQCLEYIIVHELIHLIEPTHNQNFITLLDKHMKKWRSHRDTLNKLPVRNEKWKY